MLKENHPLMPGSAVRPSEVGIKVFPVSGRDPVIIRGFGQI